MNFTDTRFFRFVATGMAFAIFNLAAPQGVVTFLAPDPNAPKPAPPIEKTPKRTRLLTAKVMRTSQGRVGGNPYLAGQNKWDILYKGVNLMTGNYSTTATDISYEGGYGIPVNVTRSYSSNGADEGPMGYGWNLSVDVRSTAGGVLKSSAAPVRSVPVNFKERPAAENDPRMLDANEPVEAVIATDAGGQEETIQKDVDGVLTTPPWDKNVIDSEYEFITNGSGAVYHVLKKNVVKTLEGTVYTYSKHGSYGTMTPRSGGATGQPSNVLKIDKAADRHGNETLYTYTTTSPVTFTKTNGTATEERLADIKMPNGHHIGFEWTGNRITKAKDLSHSGTTVLREVTYGYTSGFLTSVTSPGGKVTTYGYGNAAAAPGAPGGSTGSTGLPPGGPGGGGGSGATPSTGLLTSITDPRGLTTSIYYVMGTIVSHPTTYTVDSPVAYRVDQPNGVRLYTYVAGAPLPATDTPWLAYTGLPCSAQFYERVGSASGPTINTGSVYLRAYENSADIPIVEVVLGDSASVATVSVDTGEAGDHHSVRRYHYFTQDLLWERKSIFPKPDVNSLDLPDLAAQRRAVAPSWNMQRVETTKEYNFMGNLLEASTTESSRNASSGAWTTSAPKPVSYAYWAGDKYFQQKSIRTKKDGSNYRYSFTEYYDSNASQGLKGQSKAVYDGKHATYSLGTSWKYDIQPAAGSIATVEYPVASGADPAAYDTKGRVVRVRKLAKVTGGTPSYVETRTDYGADIDGSWGQSASVTEAFGTAASRSTFNLAYTPYGVPYRVQDSNGRITQTSYGLDGEVNWVKRVDSGLDQDLVTYTYGTSGILNGQVTTLTDGLSGVVQSFTYMTSGGGIGQVAEITQSGGGTASYAVGYTFNPAGERSVTTYSTPNGNSKWSYGDYVRVGNPISGYRAFQTIRKLDAITSAGTDEEFQYAYDSAGRLTNAIFGQVPQSVAGAPTSAPFYTLGYPALKRFQACYEIDPAGRSLGIYHRWDQWGASSYTGVPVLANESQYDSVKGLKIQSKTSVSNSTGTAWIAEGTETFSYEPERDFLISADYDGSGPSAPVTWSYDSAQNRSNSGYTYDELNRMVTSPGSVSYTYDAVGNRLTKGSATTYSWDVLRRLTGITASGSPVSSYTYRPDGLRVKKVVGSVSTVYRHDGQLPFQEIETISGTVNSVLTNVIGQRGIESITTETASGVVTRYPLYDGHGSMVGTVAKSGAASLSDRRSYDAWGGVRAGSTTGAPSTRFCAALGHQQDDESGLVYMRARYYDSSAGRFISSDPALAGINWFVYAKNNPISKTDSTGRYDEDSANASYALVMIAVLGYITATEYACSISNLAKHMHALGCVFMALWFLSDSGAGGTLGQQWSRANAVGKGVITLAVMVGPLCTEGKPFMSIAGEVVGFITQYVAFLGLFMALDALCDNI